MVASPLAPYSARWIQTNPTVTYRMLWPKTSHSGNRTRHHDQCTLLVSFSTANATHRNPARENPSIWIGGRISRNLRYPPVVVLEKTAPSARDTRWMIHDSSADPPPQGTTERSPSLGDSSHSDNARRSFSWRGATSLPQTE